MTQLELILSGVTITLTVFCGLLFKVYLPAYVKTKAKNLATKEDIAEITNSVERVRAAISQETALLEKRREVYERIADSLRIFIAGHAATEKQQEEFHAAYSACWLWAPDDLLVALNDFIQMQQDIAADRSSHSQDKLKDSFGKIMLKMRKDAGFEETEVNQGNYNFVKF